MISTQGSGRDPNASYQAEQTERDFSISLREERHGEDRRLEIGSHKGPLCF